MIDPADLQIDAYRNAVPGGQQIVKTESGVRVTHKPTGISVICTSEKSQLRNRQEAMRVLIAYLSQVESPPNGPKLRYSNERARALQADVNQFAKLVNDDLYDLLKWAEELRQERERYREALEGIAATSAQRRFVDGKLDDWTHWRRQAEDALKDYPRPLQTTSPSGDSESSETESPGETPQSGPEG